MTRDEAVELRMDAYPHAGQWERLNAEREIDCFVKLGMLKLEEPLNVADLIKDASWWVSIGRAVEVSPKSVAEAVALIGKMKTALEFGGKRDVGK